jgi:4-hydroxybutyrate CoA-transferase
MTVGAAWQERYADKVAPAEEALKVVRDGDLVVFALGAGGEPIALGSALGGRMGELKDVTAFHAVANAPYPWFQGGGFDVRCSYFGPIDRRFGQERRVDYVPWSYGTQNRQAERDRWGAYTKPDVFLVKVSPPDEEGWCSFGHSVWYSPTCARNARTVIAEVDPTFIRPCGEEARIHVSRIDYLVEGRPVDLSRIQFPPVPEEEARAAEVIGAYTAELVEDGDTLQVGVGLASQAVLPFLESKHDLGVHSELVFTEMVELVEAGVITGTRKTVDPGKVVGTCFVLWPGTERQRAAAAAIDGNPAFEFRDIGDIASVPVLAAQDNLVCVNSALMLDLTGQLCIDYLGAQPYSGTGGALDFAVGANFSRGGRCVHAMLSTAQGGKVSRIVPQLEAGAVATIPRNYVDYVITEHGVASLQGKSLRQRAEELTGIAHPDYREELRQAAQKLFWP